MIGTRLAAKKLFLVGLAAAAVVTGSAAAAMPVVTVSLHARLTSVGRMSSAGRFSGLLVRSGYGVRQQVPPPVGTIWRLRWKVSLPALPTPSKASLQIPARNGAPAVVHVLCNGCTSQTTGTLVLPNSEASRLVQSQGSVVILARSVTLRGAVKAQAIQPEP